jgi:hypothetical protein
MHEYRRATAVVPPHGGGPARQAYQESRLTVLLTGLLSELARSHPGLELGVFDLDRDSFVHRAMARALVRAGVPTTNYTERTYEVGGSAAPAARAALDSLGAAAPTVAGLWLGKFAPEVLPAAMRSTLDQADGYFLFTTFSLWVEPSRLTGPYALLGPQASYWAALRTANR